VRIRPLQMSFIAAGSLIRLTMVVPTFFSIPRAPRKSDASASKPSSCDTHAVMILIHPESPCQCADVRDPDARTVGWARDTGVRKQTPRAIRTGRWLRALTPAAYNRSSPPSRTLSDLCVTADIENAVGIATCLEGPPGSRRQCPCVRLVDGQQRRQTLFPLAETPL